LVLLEGKDGSGLRREGKEAAAARFEADPRRNWRTSRP
jgi:hypothetical protein